MSGKLIYSPIFRANLKWVTLLSEKFTYDRSVTRDGIWHIITCEDASGHVYYRSEAPNMVSHTFDISFQSSVIATWRFYLTLIFYHPRVGYFTVKLRLDDPPISRRNNTVRARITTSSRSYQKSLQQGFSARRKWLQSLPAPSVSTRVRPSPETRTKTYSRYLYAKQQGYDPWSFLNTTGTYQCYSRTWTGTRTPGYWSKARRQLPENPHTVYISEVELDPLIESSVENNGTDYTNRVDIHTLHYGAPSFQTSFNTDAYKLSRLNSYSRLRAAMQNDTANIAQDLCEFGQTIAMINTTIARVHGAHSALRCGNIPGALKALWSGDHRPRFRNGGGPSFTQSLAQNWLELQYGWKPLLQDVHDGIEKTRNLLIKSPNPLIVASARGSASKVLNYDTVIQLWSYTGIPGGTRWWTNKGATKLKVRYKMVDAQRAFLSQTGFTNPVNLAWELLPYSFVVDWFYTVGPWLESFNAFEGLEFYDGMMLSYEKQWVRDSVAYSGNPIPGSKFYLEVSSRASWMNLALYREKLTSFPVAPKPILKSPWSTVHVLNALGLLFSSFGYSRNLRV